MTLSYRGISYQKPSLALDMSEGEIKGKYRGQDWPHRYPQHISQPIAQQNKSHLIYRGLAIASDPSAQSVIDVSNGACSVPRYNVQKVVSNELSQIHFESMRKSLTRRLQIAQERGDQSLIHLLEQEFKQLTLN